MDISAIDPNFKPANVLDKKDLVWYDVRRDPFDLYGLYKPREGELFRRMPLEVADTVNGGVRDLSTNTAGGRIRFATDSPYVAVSIEMPGLSVMPHFAATGSCGMDLYVEDTRFVKSYPPVLGQHEGYTAVVDILATAFGTGMHRYTMDFPLYNNVRAVHIGLAEGSRLEHGTPYRPEAPLVYYGSSITQGACASRPGNCYQAYISRRFNVDYINLGFSGSAHGEPEIARYIAGLDMSLFVMDYDHNAVNPQALQDTHYAFYDTIRQAHPELPVVMVTRPNVVYDPVDAGRRREVVRESYEKALGQGDRNVYFIDGATLFEGLNSDDCTVDSCHPNDLGFWRMAQVIGDKIGAIFGW